MVLGSHNSWSYLPPKHWWMRPFAFIAKCQRKSIEQQYNLGVRCFDLRIKTDKYAYPHICHGLMEYRISREQLLEDLSFINAHGDCCIRVLNEVRTEKGYTRTAVDGFKEFCYWAEREFPNIRWWCGRNLYNWKHDYDFGKEPSCTELYSSVCKPRLIDDWWPWIYARRNNRKNLLNGTEADILLIDFVDIQ